MRELNLSLNILKACLRKLLKKNIGYFLVWCSTQNVHPTLEYEFYGNVTLCAVFAR